MSLKFAMQTTLDTEPQKEPPETGRASATNPSTGAPAKDDEWCNCKWRGPRHLKSWHHQMAARGQKARAEQLRTDPEAKARLRAWAREMGLKYGPIVGRRNAESGQIQALGRKWGRITAAKYASENGRRAVESGALARGRTPENLRKAVAAMAKANRENPDFKARAIALGKKWGPITGRKYGAANGRHAVESGQWERAQVMVDPEARRKRAYELGKKWGPVIGRRRGAEQGRHNVESGKIWEALEKSRRVVKDTKPELAAQRILTENGVSFEKHKLVNGHHVDLFLPSFNLVIEVDGNHLDHPSSCTLANCMELTRIRQRYPDKFAYATARQLRRDTAIRDAGYELLILPPHDPEVTLREWLRSKHA